jgi:hypothetical protein
MSILDKRATVSLEFFDHTIQTGELFKFFLVHPSSNTTSPASSSLQDSGYASSFNTSPIMSESQWTQASNSSYALSSSQSKPRASSSKAAAGDFSHIPGMKIMTKDGRDVTNTASRGCKTKEQRDHAHLMRIIKACPSCKRKKIRCDPTHRREGSSAAPSPEARVTKKTKKSASPPVPKMPAFESGMDLTLSSFDLIVPESLSLDDSFVSAAEPMDTWDQFIKYDDDEFVAVAPYNYDFFFDPAGYFSPTTSNSDSVSPTQVLTPGSPDLSQSHNPAGSSFVGSVEAHGGSLGAMGDMEESQRPGLPYLHQGRAEAGNNYVDFALYSPGSTCLDDDPTLSRELAASPGLDYSDYQRSEQFSSHHTPLSRSSQSEQSSASPQDTVAFSSIHPTDVLKNNLFSWARASLVPEPGDRGHGHQSALGVTRPAQDGIVSSVGLAHPTQSRVPTASASASPRDFNQPLPPREVDHAVPAGSCRDRRPFVTHESFGIIQDGDSFGSLHATMNDALPTTDWGTPTSTSSLSSVEQEASRTRIDVLHSTAGSFRHQRRPKVHVSTNAAATAATSTTLAANVFAGDKRIVVPQLSENRLPDNALGINIQRDNAVVKRNWSTVLAGSLHDKQLSQPWASLERAVSPQSAQSGLATAVGIVGLSVFIAAVSAQSLSSTPTVSRGVDFIFAACITAVNMVLLLATVSLTRGLRPHSSKPARSYSTGQPLKGLVGLATVLGETSWPSHTVLSLVGAQKSVRQYSVSCVAKLDPFTQALSFARRLSHGNIVDVKPKIRGSRMGIF